MTQVATESVKLKILEPDASSIKAKLPVVYHYGTDNNNSLQRDEMYFTCQKHLFDIRSSSVSPEQIGTTLASVTLDRPILTIFDKGSNDEELGELISALHARQKKQGSYGLKVANALVTTSDNTVDTDSPKRNIVTVESEKLGKLNLHDPPSPNETQTINIQTIGTNPNLDQLLDQFDELILSESTS